MHFYWVTPSATSLTWFSDSLRYILANPLQGSEQEGSSSSNSSNHLAVHLHIFVSRATKEFLVDDNEGKAFGVPFQAGRPDIKKEFKSLKSGHKGEDIAVLFCGPRKLGYKVRRQCVRRSSLKNKTRLHYHHETFEF